MASYGVSYAISLDLRASPVSSKMRVGLWGLRGRVAASTTYTKVNWYVPWENVQSRPSGPPGPWP
jgi:hypothetical protein